jgi:hypothetical protein
LSESETHQLRRAETERRAMAKTKSFRDLVQKHVKGDSKFAEALLREGVDAMLSGDLDTGKTIMRDYIKATVGFEKAWQGDRGTAEEPYPYVWPARQPASPQSVQRHRIPAKARRRAPSRHRIGMASA